MRSADQSVKGQPSPPGDPFPGEEETQEPSNRQEKEAEKGGRKGPVCPFCTCVEAKLLIRKAEGTYTPYISLLKRRSVQKVD